MRIIENQHGMRNKADPLIAFRVNVLDRLYRHCKTGANVARDLLYGSHLLERSVGSADG